MDTEEEHCRVFSVCRSDSKIQFEYYVTKFAASHNVDFTNCPPGGAKIERENNLKEFKSAYDIDSMPKSGAGSEYGREQREEARKKKYGIRTRNYNPNDQPFILKMGAGKQQRRLKGTKNGGVSKNTNYVAFALNGNAKFVSLPLSDWYDFTPMPKYKALNAEEAEEQFSKRDKTYNHFAIMCNKKYNKGKEDDDQEKEIKSSKANKKNKHLMLTEFELMSGSEEEDSDKDEIREDEEEKDSKKKIKKKKKETKEEHIIEVDEEAIEENDEADEGQELDYFSMSSEEEDMYDNDARDESDKYNDVGVAEEEGLKRFGSDNEDEEAEDEDKKDDEDNDKVKNKADSDFDSGSDSDIETNSLFDMPSGKGNKSPSTVKETKNDSFIDKKRKCDSPEITTKRQKFDDSNANKAEVSIEEIVKKCLLRKPTSVTELIRKLGKKQAIFNSYSKNEIQNILFTVMKKLKPQSKSINKTMYFFLQTNKA